jgi:hypothetical protein
MSTIAPLIPGKNIPVTESQAPNRGKLFGAASGKFREVGWFKEVSWKFSRTMNFYKFH